MCEFSSCAQSICQPLKCTASFRTEGRSTRPPVKCALPLRQPRWSYTAELFPFKQPSRKRREA